MKVFRFVCVEKICPYEVDTNWFRTGCLSCSRCKVELVDEEVDA